MLFCCLLTGSYATAQTIVSGTILDSETGKPVESVFIQNHNHSESSALTDESGSFSLKAFLSDTLNLYRIGYESEVIVCRDTVLNIKINPKDYILNEIVITYEEADEIYQKAFANLIIHYLPGPVTYLWHGVFSEDDAGIRKTEAYTRFIATANRKKAKKIEFDLRLLDLNRIKNTAGFRSLDLPYYVDGLNSQKPPSNNTIIKINSEDDSLILLRYVNSKGKIPYTRDIIINKADTVLLCMKSAHYEPEITAKKWGIQFGTIYDICTNLDFLVKKRDAGYCIDKYEYKLSYYYTRRKSSERNYLEIESVTTFVNTNNYPDPQKLKKLDGGTKQLFKLESTTSEHFWEQ